MPRYWTLAEARAALPEVLELLRELQAALRVATAELESGAPEAGKMIGPLVRSTNGSHRPETPATAQDEVRRLIRQFEQLGVQVKDAHTGLLDFPCLRDGEEVLLCFRQGEPDILFWHPIETGFAGRRPIDEL